MNGPVIRRIGQVDRCDLEVDLSAVSWTNLSRLGDLKLQEVQDTETGFHDSVRCSGGRRRWTERILANCTCLGDRCVV